MSLLLLSSLAKLSSFSLPFGVREAMLTDVSMGGRLMKVLLSAVKLAGVKGVHLEMAACNSRAYAFYCKLGFEELYRDEEDIIMGLSF